MEMVVRTMRADAVFELFGFEVLMMDENLSFSFPFPFPSSSSSRR